MSQGIEECVEEKRVSMNIALSAEDKKFLKVFAAQNDTTVSAVIHEYVEMLRREIEKNGK